MFTAVGTGDKTQCPQGNQRVPVTVGGNAVTGTGQIPPGTDQHGTGGHRQPQFAQAQQGHQGQVASRGIPGKDDMIRVVTQLQ